MPPTSASASRLEALQTRHAAINSKIELEQGRPGSSEFLLSRLKRQRLHLKEQIEGISG
ncbi:MAG: DUF465 domain-containing protein [Micavibrio aeruginosavorus]|uniref:DUF465 domain-containing protein n=1 Tax=Micavibrio aeruginosavorus TaxID=349221 RepID=A0A2W5MXX6_9BACT|nr:MAG: DUF465 domain-containing protein [Micavibrio aeruginosavorus]